MRGIKVVWIVAALLVAGGLLLPGCNLSSDCGPGEDCSFLLDPAFLGAWEAQEPHVGGMARIEVVGSVNNYVVHGWQVCVPEDCYWGEASVSSGLISPDFLNDPALPLDAIGFFWPERTPSARQELWLRDEDRALLKTFFGGGAGDPDIVDEMIR